MLKQKHNARDGIAESSGDIRSESEFNDRDSNPLDRMIAPHTAASQHTNQQIASKPRVNTLVSGGSSSNHPKEYYDTFGAGEINFSEDAASNYLPGGQGGGAAFYGDSSLNNRLVTNKAKGGEFNKANKSAMRVPNSQSSLGKKS